ncbi:hypothetical protein C8Q76DRAFT_621326 [Earliella scabrosa]|nr:hypothetical protein C8Q76DRAFT_621326 [Earliella scabrosa]
MITFPGIEQRYRLAGIVYYHNLHFVCRVIDKGGQVWFHDGVVNGESAIYEDNVINMPMKKLQRKGEYIMSILIYSKF